MNKGYLIDNCKFYDRRTYTRQGCGCNSCKMAISDYEKSYLQYQNHVIGIRCYKYNTCSKCAFEMTLMRRLKHISFDGDRCSKKKCESCKGEIYIGRSMLKHNNLVIAIYKIMFRKGTRWKYQ